MNVIRSFKRKKIKQNNCLLHDSILIDSLFRLEIWLLGDFDVFLVEDRFFNFDESFLDSQRLPLLVNYVHWHFFLDNRWFHRNLSSCVDSRSIWLHGFRDHSDGGFTPTEECAILRWGQLVPCVWTELRAQRVLWVAVRII